MREWLREQGETVADRGQISADRRARYYAAHPGTEPRGWVEPIPSPDDDEWEDLGEMAPDPGPEPGMPADGPESDGEPRTGPRKYRAVPEGPQPLSDDPGPAHATRDFRRRARGGQKSKPGRVTVSVRADIGAKIEFALTVPGTIWAARDPLCGGTFVQQTPGISTALTDIVCESPDLVAFFSGPGGAFMRYLQLVIELQPVFMMAMAHHVYHTIEPQADMTQPDYQDYAA